MRDRYFTLDNQLQFAQLSGDFNPMHIDPVYARRLIYGKAVVHGIHSLLWSIEEWLKTIEAPFVHIDRMAVSFNRSIGLDERVMLHLTREDGNSVELHLQNGGMASTKIKIEWHACAAHGNSDAIPDCSPSRIECCDLTKEALLGKSERFDLEVDRGEFLSLFPVCHAKISVPQYASLLTTTRIVGVHCPGLNSVFQELTLAFAAVALEPTMRYSVTAFDERFSLATLALDGGVCSGRIKAFYRPPIKQQRSISELRSLVDKSEFSGQRAVVVGGSRGLGEVTAKLLAAGGADVKLTYASGEAEASQIVNDIREEGLRAEAFYCDVRTLNGVFSESRPDGWMPTHLYFFATPFITCAERGRFSTEIFDRFTRCYVSGFMNCVNYFKSTALKNILYPSSVFVDELPLNMGEYAAAKIAGEVLCSYLEKTMPSLKILKPRMPRMDTDQTASLYSVPSNDPVPIMLDYLREMAK